MKTLVILSLFIHSVRTDVPFLDTRTQCLGKHQMSYSEEYDIDDVPKYYKPIIKQNFEVIPTAISLANDGLTLLMHFTYKDYEDAPTISEGPLSDNGKYRLDHIYMNWLEINPPEWDHEDITFPAELHIVFYSTKYSKYEEAIIASNGLAILAFGFEVNPLVELKELTNVIGYFYDIIKPPSSIQLRTEHIFALEHFISKNLYDYFTYPGSFLTAPDCSATVIWIDFIQPLQISPNQVAGFKQLDNFYGISLQLTLQSNYHTRPAGVVYKSTNVSLNNAFSCRKLDFILFFICIYSILAYPAF